jgi:hypothetical protein
MSVRRFQLIRTLAAIAMVAEIPRCAIAHLRVRFARPGMTG